jgi:HMG (high mobility group) box
MIEDHRPRKRNKRGPKDPAAPKRASGAYVFFTNEMRPIVMKEFPGIKFVEMGRILGERWRSLSGDEKKRYEDMAAEDKVRFQMEFKQYTADQAEVGTIPQQVSPPTAAYGQYDYSAVHGYPHHDPYVHNDPYSQQAHQFQYHQA